MRSRAYRILRTQLCPVPASMCGWSHYQSHKHPHHPPVPPPSKTSVSVCCVPIFSPHHMRTDKLHRSAPSCERRCPTATDMVGTPTTTTETGHRVRATTGIIMMAKMHVRGSPWLLRCAPLPYYPSTPLLTPKPSRWVCCCQFC